MTSMNFVQDCPEENIGNSHLGFEVSKPENLLESEEFVREAITKIWISHQGKQTNPSFEEELNINCNQSIHRVKVDLTKIQHAHTQNQNHSPGDSAEKSSESFRNCFSHHLPKEKDSYTMSEKLHENKLGHLSENGNISVNYSRITSDNKLESVDNSKDSNYTSFKLPHLSNPAGPSSRQSSANSNGSSPLPSPTRSASPAMRTRFSSHSPRSPSTLIDASFHHEGAFLTTSLPASPNLRRTLVSRSAELYCNSEQPHLKSNLETFSNHNENLPLHSVGRKRVTSSPRLIRKRPDTPVARLSHRGRCDSLSKSCSDLHRISETAPVYPSSGNRDKLFPSIVN